MGAYDQINFKNTKGKERSIQFKNGECKGKTYSIGRYIELENGVYFGNEGAFVVFDNKVVAAFDKDEQFMIDKWGGVLDYPELESHIQVALKDLKKPKIYISGRITGLDIDYAISKFKEAEEYVRKEMPYEPVNPFDVCEQNDDFTWLDYMRADIIAMMDCDAILMLDNWKESEGATLELEIAKGLKYKVYYL